MLLAISAAAGGLLAGVTFRDRPQSGPIEVLLAAVTLFFAFVIGSYLVTGCIELITGSAVVSATNAALAASLALVAIVLCYGEARRDPLRFFRAGYTHALAALGNAVRALGRAEPRVLVMSAVTLVAALAISSFIMGFPRGSEATAYHLPNGVWALQTESLRIRDGIYYSALPANSGIWYAFLLSLLPERFTALGELPFLPVLALAIYGIARRAGADRRGSVFAAVGIMSLPVITLQAALAESDIAGLTFIAIALYFLVSAKLPPARYVLAGLAIGLAFGFKSVSLMGGGLLVAAAMTEPWWRGSESAAPYWNRWTRQTGALVAAALVMGGFWVVRNMLETGNPLYPVYIKRLFDVLGWPPAWDVDYSRVMETQFRWVRSIWEWPVYPWIEWHYADSGTHYKSNAGLGAFFAAAMPVLVLHTTANLIVRARRGGWDDACAVRLVLLVGGTLLVAAWSLIGDREPRYVSAAWVFLIPLAGCTINGLTERPRILLEGLWWVCIWWMFFSFLAQEMVTFGDRVLYSRIFSKDRYFEYPSVIDRLPAGATIVNLDERVSNYPLVGSRNTNRVINFQWSLRTFGVDVTPQSLHNLKIDSDAKGIFLETSALRKLAATHVYVRSYHEVKHDACVRLKEVGRLDRNPLSGGQIAPPKVLYEIEYCTGPIGSDRKRG